MHPLITEPTRTHERYLIGVDLGQSQDYTAIVVIQMFDTQGKKEYDLRHLERPDLGTPYPVVVNRIAEIVEDRRLGENKNLVVDATGVGRPVVDMMQEKGLRPYAMTITASTTEYDKVAKRDLVSTLQVVLQTSRLKIAEGLPLAPVLVKELVNFKAKISNTGHDSYEAWRDGVHDDLVLATALAVWHGEQRTTLRSVHDRVTRALTPW